MKYTPKFHLLVLGYWGLWLAAILLGIWLLPGWWGLGFAVVMRVLGFPVAEAGARKIGIEPPL